MAVKPYWWCGDCKAVHDSSVSACVSCGGRVFRKTMQVPSIEATARGPDWNPYIPRDPKLPRVDRLSRDDTRELQAAAVRRVLESGPGIAALALGVPSRARPARHETKAWDPHGMPLPDAEPGRYGWLS